MAYHELHIDENIELVEEVVAETAEAEGENMEGGQGIGTEQGVREAPMGAEEGGNEGRDSEEGGDAGQGGEDDEAAAEDGPEVRTF